MNDENLQDKESAANTRSQIVQFFGLSQTEINHQIEEHKYFLNLSFPEEISLEVAFDSWSRNVFSPLMRAMEEQGLEIEFADLGKDELFVRVSDHWYFLKKEEDVETSAQKAVLSYGALFAKNDMSRLEFYTKKLHLEEPSRP